MLSCPGRTIVRIVGSTLLTILLLTLSACGRSDLATFSGVVLLDGEPLSSGGLMFQPEKGGQPGQARIQSDGTFTISTDSMADGATIGWNKVRVYDIIDPSQAANTSSDEENGLAEITQGRIPKRYSRYDTSGLRVEVKANNGEPCVIQLRTLEVTQGEKAE